MFIAISGSLVFFLTNYTSIQTLQGPRTSGFIFKWKLIYWNLERF
uniref:Uncharacterized protein n=1 Tax=Rhizophora mucronata TaxID=61149 RepID=A0A2P2N8V5_RHIMU